MRRDVRRALAHQCHACRRHWALRVVLHPSGRVVLCSYCSTVRAIAPARRPRQETPA